MAARIRRRMLDNEDDLLIIDCELPRHELDAITLIDVVGLLGYRHAQLPLDAASNVLRRRAAQYPHTAFFLKGRAESITDCEQHCRHADPGFTCCCCGFADVVP